MTKMQENTKNKKVHVNLKYKYHKKNPETSAYTYICVYIYRLKI